MMLGTEKNTGAVWTLQDYFLVEEPVPALTRPAASEATPFAVQSICTVEDCLNILLFLIPVISEDSSKYDERPRLQE